MCVLVCKCVCVRACVRVLLIKVARTLDFRRKKLLFVASWFVRLWPACRHVFVLQVWSHDRRHSLHKPITRPKDWRDRPPVRSVTGQCCGGENSQVASVAPKIIAGRSCTRFISGLISLFSPLMGGHSNNRSLCISHQSNVHLISSCPFFRPFACIPAIAMTQCIVITGQLVKFLLNSRSMCCAL